MDRLQPQDLNDAAYESGGKTSKSNQSGWCDSALRGQSQRCRENMGKTRGGGEAS